MIVRLSALVSRIGRRGTFLLFLALLDIIYAIGLSSPTVEATRSSTLLFLSSVLSLNIWAALWLVVGVICLVYAFRKDDSPGFTAAVFLKCLWAVLFLTGWILGEVERGYLSAAVWGALGGVTGLIATWPESRGV